MGWKGVVRSVQAAHRAAERDAKKRQRELERQQKELEKLEEYERAEYEVNLFENSIEIITSIHKQCSDEVKWGKLAKQPPPHKPIKKSNNEKSAKEKLDNFKPTFANKILRNAEKKREELKKYLENSIEADENNYKKDLTQYNQELQDWSDTTELAKKILEGDKDSYINAIKSLNPFEEISDLGSSVKFELDEISKIAVEVFVNSESIIPNEIKSLSKSGKLLSKQMPKGRFLELYQDYVCGGSLRIARELFNLLPINTVIVHSISELLNTHSGHLEKVPILSVSMPRETIAKLNFELLDPSDSMSNFLHNMSFKKTSGFSAVEKIN